METNSKDKQMYQLHKKGYEDIAKAISKAVTVRVDGSEVHLEAPKGEPGKDGKTPVKGIDYFTKDEVDDIVQEVFSKIPTPKNGKDGIVDYDKVSQFIKSEISKIKIPKPQDGKDAVVDYGSIINAVLKQIPVPKEIDYEEVRKYIEKSVEKTRMAIRPLVSGGPTTMLGTIADVRIDGATAGQVLTYDGSKWVATTVSGGGTVESVNGQTGTVVLDADDIDDTSTTNKFVTSTEKTDISTALQPGDNVSDLTNDAGYLADVDIADINATGTPSGSTFLRGDGAWTSLGGGGTVTSVSATVPTGLTISGSPITEAGTLAIGLDTDRVIPTQAIIDGKANVSHTHPTTDLTATGGTATSFLRKDNTWATPTNTTYAEITEAEINTGTATTLRTITGRRAGFILGKTVQLTGNQTIGGDKTFTGTTSGITSTMVGLGNVDNTSDATKNSANATLTNKRITKRVQTIASSGTVTASLDNDDMVVITAQATALTLANPSGTGTQGQSLVFRIKDNGTAQTIGYGANFRAIGVTLPTTTVINKTIYLGGFWNATDSRLDIVAVAEEE